MSLNVSLAITVHAPSGPVSFSKLYTGSGLLEISEAVPNGSNYLINGAIDVSATKMFYIACDQNVTVKTNSSSVPDDTLTLVANVPYQWTTDSYDTFLLDTDVTKFYVTNSSGVSANLQIKALQDATP